MPVCSRLTLATVPSADARSASAPQTVNAALVGLFIALTALSALSVGPRSRLRLLNAALAVWLLVSMAAFPTRTIATEINSAVVAVLVLAFALIPRASRPVAPRPA